MVKETLDPMGLSLNVKKRKHIVLECGRVEQMYTKNRITTRWCAGMWAECNRKTEHNGTRAERGV